MAVHIPGGNAGRGLMRLTRRGTEVILSGSGRHLGERRNHAVNTIGRVASLLKLRRVVHVRTCSVSGAGNFRSMNSVIICRGKGPGQGSCEGFGVGDIGKPSSCTDVERILAHHFARKLGRHRRGTRTKGFAAFPSLVLVSKNHNRMGVTLRMLSRLGLGVPMYNVMGSSGREAEKLCCGGIRVPVSHGSRTFGLVAEVRSRTRQFTVRFRERLHNGKRMRSILSSVRKVNPTEEGTLVQRCLDLSTVQDTAMRRLTRLPSVGRGTTRSICRFFRSWKFCQGRGRSVLVCEQ